MNSEEVATLVRKNVAWAQLPVTVKQQLGNSAKEYDKCIIHLSLKNQLRYKGSLVQRLRKDESKYYEDLLEFGWKNLLLFPYHLSDVIIKGLGITPFQYYINMLDNQMAQEKSYDSLPNFTAADCLRLIGVGRNQYIELMNSCRSNRRFGLFRKSGRELLPTAPLESVPILPWWYVHIAYITEEDMKTVDKAEHCLIDQIIDNGSCPAGYLNYQTVRQLFTKGFIYFDVPIDDDDYVAVPPLENFVMNRVQGDYFETLLYKIFVSIDENTNVSELAKILEVDAKLVKNAVSLYCRLGFARKKNSEMDSSDIHPSWYTSAPNAPRVKNSTNRSVSVSSDEDDSLLKELNKALEVEDDDLTAESMGIEIIKSPDAQDLTGSGNAVQKKIAFLFDSTLTAYLMMGNLSVGLKTHAVTMFEVGKLSDESLDSLVSELDQVSTEDGEGEAARYYLHARNLKQTIQFLRSNASFKSDSGADGMCLPLDLVRCESLQSLDPRTASRLLGKNYSLLISMAPLTNEIRPADDCFPPHLGPAIPEVSSVWFKMFLYHTCGSGPPSLLLPKGYKISRLPKIFENYGRLLVTTWGHDPTDIPISGALSLLLEALQHSPVLIQAYSSNNDVTLRHIPFPLSTSDSEKLEHDLPKWKGKAGQKMLPSSVDVRNCCGYISLLKLKDVNDNFRTNGEEAKNGQMNDENASLLQEEVDNIPDTKPKKLALEDDEDEGNWMLMDIKFGIPLFDSNLNKDICQGIVINSLWKSENLQAVEKSGQKLGQMLNEFIASHQDLPLTEGSKVWATPEERRKSPVPMPTRLLFFDGHSLHEKI